VEDGWAIERGAVRNDAFHISSPSKNGEGAFLALSTVTEGVDTSDLAFVNAHGTATMFNDQMESVAIGRAGLNDVPVNAYKGYFGHTLGAAGILETVLSMAAVDDHTVLATRGFDERGVSGNIRLSSQNSTTDKKSFVKMISGFGGGNAALLVRKNENRIEELKASISNITHRLRLTSTSLMIDGNNVALSETGAPLLIWLYKNHIDDYPKFYKMDGLSRLGLVASELLLKAEALPAESPVESRAVILFNRSSSIVADKLFLSTIARPDNYFPSPSVFVYTLPNIVTGEIAMRNHYHGETSFYISDKRNDPFIWQVIQASFADRQTKSVLGGWIDYQDDSHFEADLFITTK
jgi:3-oxoacyl-[acyl-carrier-protein] synthase-1